MRACRQGNIYLKISAKASGQSNKGNTLPEMSINDSINEPPPAVRINVSEHGTATATAKFTSIVYEISDEALPPSLAVITAAAVAVGQMRQSIAASTSTDHSCG